MNPCPAAGYDDNTSMSQEFGFADELANSVA